MKLARLTKKRQSEDELTLNDKVYISPVMNANATAAGLIRVYSGLMDQMTDAELLGVIGHEIGHVKLGHSINRMRTAYLASAGRKATGSAGGVSGALAASEIGDMSEKFVNSQFSQSQETASDDYGVQFLKRNGYDLKAMASGLRKLAELSGGKSGAAQLFSSHPEPVKRARQDRATARDFPRRGSLTEPNNGFGQVDVEQQVLVGRRGGARPTFEAARGRACRR